MSKRVVKMNESVLHRLIKESISRVISEMDEGKYSNNKPFFHGGVRDVKPGEKAFKHTNPGADEKALEKHNARMDKHLPDIMNSDKLKAREAQVRSSKRGGMPRENFKDTLEGKLKNKKQEYKQVSESDLHRIVKESVQRVLRESLDDGVIPSDFFENPYQYNNLIDLGTHKLSYSGFETFAAGNLTKCRIILGIYLPNGEHHFKQQILDLGEAQNWTDDKTYGLYVMLCKMYGIQPAKY